MIEAYLRIENLQFQGINRYREEKVYERKISSSIWLNQEREL